MPDASVGNSSRWRLMVIADFQLPIAKLVKAKSAIDNWKLAITYTEPAFFRLRSRLWRAHQRLPSLRHQSADRVALRESQPGSRKPRTLLSSSERLHHDSCQYRLST